MSEARSAVIDFRSFEPYYLQLERILVKDLQNNRAEGHLLPSEAELCAQYSVSRTVVRQALSDLEREGPCPQDKGERYLRNRAKNGHQLHPGHPGLP